MNRLVFALLLLISAFPLLAARDFPGSTNVLYLGDSLADFDRGSNCVDKLQFRLDAKWPGRIRLHNYAIRGDYIARMMDRMNGRRYTYELSRYAGIWGRRYDWAFVSLGHNDTRARSDTGFTVPLMSEKELRSGFADLIGLLKKKGVERIILVSAASLDFRRTEKLTERSLAAIAKGKAAKKAVTRFGDPVMLEKFNAVMSDIAAADPKVEYLDVYSAMKSHPDKASLFRKDGVHLNQKGHGYLADRLFEHVTGVR